MQMNFRSMVYPQPSDVFPQPYMKSSELLFENGLPHIGYVAPAIKSPSIHGAVSAVAHPWTTAKLPKEPQQLGWVGSVHNFGCAFNSESIPLKTTYDVKTSCHEYKLPAANPKHFLVFDQSGDKTTLVYSSEINRTQFHFNFSTNSKLPSPLPIEDHSHNSNKRKSEICNEEAPFCWSPELTTYKVNDDDDDDDGDDTGGCIRSDSGSEMREDTEEINALLYSDDDELESSEDDDDDDEVTSTGHSPPSDELLDDYKGNENFAGWYEDGHAIAEQVASSFSYPTKRLKTSHGACDVVGLSLMENSPTTMLDTSRPSSDNEDDAESGCGDFNSVDYDDVDFLDAVVSCGGSKEGWLKEERIREALGILKSIVPDGGKGAMDAVSVIDEAIIYLRCLKVKAKSLGLS